MQVYVLHKNGNPLMPCHPARARMLLKKKQAKVIKMIPFTIQLTNDSTENVQEVTLGIDPGDSVGISVVTEKKVLYEEIIEMRKDVSQLIIHRREMRRTRRFRKTRYRKARFMNRAIPKGWIAPTLRQKLQTYESIVNRVCKILPIKKCICEYTQFNIQKLNDPNISSSQHQHGPAEGFENIKAYVRDRDNYTCQYCKKQNIKLHVHHIVFKSKGGTDRPDNLITLCEQCHNDLHTGKIQLKLKKLSNSFKAASHLNILKDRLFELLELKFGKSNVIKTYGYETSYIRLQYNLSKEHYVDAQIIAGSYQLQNDFIYYSKKVRRHNRKLHDEKFRKGGKRRSVRLPYKVFNYQPYDIILYNDKDFHNVLCCITSRENKGFFTFKTFNNVKIKRSYKHIKKFIQKSNGFITLYKKNNILRRENIHCKNGIRRIS